MSNNIPLYGHAIFTIFYFSLAFGLFVLWGCCEDCCCEHSGTSFCEAFQFSLGGIVGHMVTSFNLLRKGCSILLALLCVPNCSVLKILITSYSLHSQKVFLLTMKFYVNSFLFSYLKTLIHCCLACIISWCEFTGFLFFFPFFVFFSPESESFSVVSDSLWPPWTVQSMEFSRPEYWGG